MTIPKSITMAVAAAVLGGTAALAVPAMASANANSTTLKFTTVEVSETQFTATTAGGEDTDVNSAGSTIGYDVDYYTVTGTTSATANAAFTLNGGVLYATFSTTNSGETFSGPVTGGTGAFRGATGTISAKPISSTEYAVTICYST